MYALFRWVIGVAKYRTGKAFLLWMIQISQSSPKAIPTYDYVNCLNNQSPAPLTV